MFKSLLIVLGLLVSATNFSFAAQVIHDSSGPIVEKIVVNGAGDLNDQALEGMLLEIGKPLSRELLDASEDWLWQHLRMRVLQVSQEAGQDNDSVVLIFSVEPLRSWQHIIFEGNNEFEIPDLESAVRIVGQAIHELELGKYEQRLIDFYYESGFRGTSVSAEDRGDHLAFVIDEGNQLTVSAVLFEGNTFFPEGSPWKIFHWGDDLYGDLAQINGVFNNDPFSQDLIVEDINTLVQMYRDYGFLDVSINCRIEEQEDNSSVVLVYEITEGDRFTIRSVSFQSKKGGALVFDDADLHDSIPLKAGQNYSSALLTKAIYDLSIKYGEAGHPSDSKVISDSEKLDEYFWVGNSNGSGQPEILFDIDKPVVDVVFVIHEGESFRLRDVVLRGYLGSEDRVVRRAIELEPGDEAREDIAVRSWRRLNGLSYFKDEANNPAVNWHWRQVGPETNLLDLVFEVQDKGAMNNFSFGGAWNSETGPALMVRLTKTNVDIYDMPESFSSVFTDLLEGKAFHGSGQSFSLSAQPGKRFSSFALSFTEPDLLGEHVDRFGLNLRASKSLRYFRTHDEERSSFGFTFSRRFGRFFSVFGGPSVGNVGLVDLSANSPQSMTSFEGFNAYRSLTFGVRHNTVADRFSPVDGSNVSANIIQTGSFLGGEWDFLKSTVRATKHIPLWEDLDSRRWILSLKGAVQKAWLQGDMNTLPYSEGFFQGGNRNLRGFAYRGTNIDANGFSVPGAATWSGSIELGFPLFATRNRKSVNLLESLRGAAFIDFGASGSDFGDMDPTRVSAGLAFRLRMPALAQLPMSFILAKPLHSEEGDQTSTFQFLIGSF
ncbi:MAG: BamA/TamA family outer membrane protein [Planctomycetes bacterium]|nr:BamA/TamA family outer membrane protein [Planctomycetota bacterium]